MARLSEFHNWHNDVWGRQDGISDDNVDITTGARHGSLEVSMANLPDTTGCNRSHKSDRGVSRGVWEATTTEIRGSTRGSKPRRFCFENGDDWDSQSWAPSVVSLPFQKEITMFLQAIPKNRRFQKSSLFEKWKHAQIKVDV